MTSNVDLICSEQIFFFIPECLIWNVTTLGVKPMTLSLWVKHWLYRWTTRQCSGKISYRKVLIGIDTRCFFSHDNLTQQTDLPRPYTTGKLVVPFFVLFISVKQIDKYMYKMYTLGIWHAIGHLFIIKNQLSEKPFVHIML